MTTDPRHDRRRGVILALYQYDAGRGDDLDSIREGLAAAEIPDELIDEAMTMATAIWSAHDDLDTRIAVLAPTWPPSRQPAVDRAILRLGLWELDQADVPPAVTIDEAVELSHEFGTEQTAAFVNGVLDAAHTRSPKTAAES